MSFDIRGVGLALIAGAGLVLSSADCASNKSPNTTGDAGIDTGVGDVGVAEASHPDDTSATDATTNEAGGDSATTETGTDAPDGGPIAPLGPGAALSCTSSGKNAWLTYGMSTFVAIDAAIFTSVTAELTQNGTSNLGGSFEEVGDVDADIPALHDSLPTFKGELAAFLVFEFGGPTTITYTDGIVYSGQVDLVAAHTGLGITQAQYDYFVANILLPSMTGNGVTSDDITSCFAPIINDPGFGAMIVGH